MSFLKYFSFFGVSFVIHLSFSITLEINVLLPLTK